MDVIRVAKRTSSKQQQNALKKIQHTPSSSLFEELVSGISSIRMVYAYLGSKPEDARNDSHTYAICQ